jgi:DNA mismatch endonuclease, patch repair protein
VVDIVAPEVRSRMMASIKGRDTKPEMLVRRYLHRQGFRYRLSPKGIPGRPDLVLRRHGAVVLVHGCYWHSHAGCRYATVPSTNAETWQAKLAGNRLRDARVISDLLSQGWRVAVIWECALKKRPEIALEKLQRFIASNRRSVEIPSSPHVRRKE